MKKTAILLAALLMLTMLAACGSDSDSGSEAAQGEVLSEVEFDVDNKAILWADDAYAYDDPIILENDGDNLGGWLVENDPGAYWGVTFPEAGDYLVTINYARGEPGEARGSVAAEYWNEEEKEWYTWSGIAMYFDSTGDWSDYSGYSERVMAELEGGQTYRFAIVSDANEETTGEYFINLRSVVIEPAPENEADDVSSEEETDDSGGEETDDSDGEAYVETDIPLILTNDGVYYHHESGEGNLQFFPDGRAQLNAAGSIQVCEYAIEYDAIYLTADGEDFPFTHLTIIDLCTLEDADGAIYAVPDSEGQEIVERSFYWRNAGDEGMFFDILGVMRLQSADGAEVEGSYEVNGDYVTVRVNDEMMKLKIINRRVLRLGIDEAVFVRLP